MHTRCSARRAFRHPVLVSCAALALTFASGVHAEAGGTEEVRIADVEAFRDGTFERTLVDSDGVVRPGPSFDASDLGASTAWDAIDHAGATWIGTGNQARLVRVEGTATRSIDLGPGLLVTALAGIADGGVVAAVFPGARLVRVDVRGDDTSVTPLATLPVEHVWALAADGRGGVVAATGGPAALYAVDALGTVTRRAELKDDHARCLARDEDAWLVGTAPNGHVLRVAADGATTVVFDLAPQEVTGLVRIPDGSIVIAANADDSGGDAQAIESLVEEIAKPAATKPGGRPAPRPGLQSGHLFHLDREGVLTTLWTEDTVATLSLAADGRGAVAGTGPGARLVRVEPDRASGVLGDLPEAEASVVLSDGEGRLATVVTSNPVVLHRRSSGGTTASRWTSAALDAGAIAVWGRLRAEGAGLLELAVRSGPVEEPDASWSGWEVVGGDTPGVADPNLTARFAQVRVTLDPKAGELRAVRWVRRGPNRPPVLSGVEVVLPDASSDGAVPTKASPTREIKWKVEDPDGDELLARIDVRRHGVVRWHVLVDDETLDKSTWSWDTTGWPDGLYDVRVRISDGGGNAPARTRVAERSVAAHRVDNTPPRVEARIERDGEGSWVVTARAEDPADGRIVRVRASLNGKPWVHLAPEDGLFDEPDERAVWRLTISDDGPHDVVVQAFDALGNVGAAVAVTR